VISQEEIERAGQSTFIELLQKQPGIEIGSNGGAGTISSVFMRGTSSNQIVVLIDGVRVNSITDSATYFGNIPLSQIEHIEILRGTASSLYGQDALGGVIQLFTKKLKVDQDLMLLQVMAATTLELQKQDLAGHIMALTTHSTPQAKIQMDFQH